MTNLERGDQSIEREFGNNADWVAVGILAITAGFFVWFLLAERLDNAKRNDAVLRLQQYMYDKMVIIDLEQRLQGDD